jgi:hypothetical protein
VRRSSACTPTIEKEFGTLEYPNIARSLRAFFFPCPGPGPIQTLPFVVLLGMTSHSSTSGIDERDRGEIAEGFRCIPGRREAGEVRDCAICQ